MLAPILKSLSAAEELAPRALEDALHQIMQGSAEPAQVASLLTFLAAKPPRAELLAAGARALRAHRVAIHPQVRPLIDTCGTGGDGAHSINVSTAAALVVAASGGAVAKHGNRAVSSTVGSADVLEACGCTLALPPQRAVELLDATGFVFLFAPAFHPAMRHVAPVRRSLGFRTIFNLLGPLANPGLAEFQLVGVFAPELTGVVAEALRLLGSRGALVVHCAGLDEIGLHAPTTGHRLQDGQITPFHLDVTALGLMPRPLAALRGGDAARNAELLRAALAGNDGPHSDVVALNAGAALAVAGLARDLAEGLAQAREAMQSGAALRVLARYAESSSELARSA